MWLLCVCFAAAALRAQADPITITNGVIDATLSSANGALLSIAQAGGPSATLGSRGGCLWGSWSNTDSSSFVGGCSYTGSQFAYAWNGTATKATSFSGPGVLSLSFTRPALNVTVDVKVPPAPASHIEAALTLSTAASYTVNNINFPSDLGFNATTVSEGFLGVLPGVQILPAYFQSYRKTKTANYPGEMFADFQSVKSGGARLTTFVRPPALNLASPAVVSFQFPDSAPEFITAHTFATVVDAGQQYKAPPVVLSVEPDLNTVIQLYAEVTGLSTAPSLSARTDAALLHMMTTSPLVKADAEALNLQFSDYATQLFPSLPKPCLFHPAAYEVNGFDRNYPDLLPPASRFGTQTDMAAMFDAARASGMIVMPYTNPTWWDVKSPTVQNLPPPLTLRNITALNSSGDPIVETYGPNSGVAVCPWSPFVRARIDTLVYNFSHSVVSDMLFQDQLGARSWKRDFNPLEPLSPMSFFNGWVQNAENYAKAFPVMTERGTDALVLGESGFHGGIALDKANGATKTWYGSDTNWKPYPLATLAARRSVLFYQHDLAPSTMTSTKYQLTWNAALGYMLSYDASPFPQAPFNATWLAVTSVFQTNVLALYQEWAMTGYGDAAPSVTNSTFSNGAGFATVIGNWNAAATYNYSTSATGSVLVENGLFIDVVTADLTVRAGVVSTWYHQALSAGDHAIVEQRGGNAVTLWHPLGGDTAVSVPPLQGWASGGDLKVEAYAGDTLLSTMSGTFTGGNVQVQWVRHPFRTKQEATKYVVSVGGKN